jgi:hypothetical protein
MLVILENTETGELKELHDKGSFRAPWRIKETIRESSPKKKHMEAAFAVWATQLNIPVPQFLDAARWLLNKNCPYCELGTKVLKRIKELGEKRSIELIQRILVAKDADNRDELETIRQEING